MSSCMIWSQHSRLHGSCAPWQCSGCDLRAATVLALRIFPFLNSDRIIDGLIAELPDYVAAAQDVVVTTEEEKVKWWCQHVERLPCWSVAVKQVLLVQPFSAAAERAFSLLSAAFSDQQDRALADYLQASVMLQYNKRWCWLVYTILIHVYSNNYWCWKNSKLSRQVNLLRGLILSAL